MSETSRRALVSRRARKGCKKAGKRKPAQDYARTIATEQLSQAVAKRQTGYKERDLSEAQISNRKAGDQRSTFKAKKHSKNQQKTEEMLFNALQIFGAIFWNALSIPAQISQSRQINFDILAGRRN
jgi:hypothetical protein